MKNLLFFPRLWKGWQEYCGWSPTNAHDERVCIDKRTKRTLLGFYMPTADRKSRSMQRLDLLRAITGVEETSYSPDPFQMWPEYPCNMLGL